MEVCATLSSAVTAAQEKVVVMAPLTDRSNSVFSERRLLRKWGASKDLPGSQM